MPCPKIVLQHCVPDNAREGHSKVPGHQCCSTAVMEVPDLKKSLPPKMTVTMQVLEVTIHFNNINKIFIKNQFFGSCCLVFLTLHARNNALLKNAPHLCNGFPHPRRFPEQLIRHVTRGEATGFLHRFFFGKSVTTRSGVMMLGTAPNL